MNFIVKKYRFARWGLRMAFRAILGAPAPRNHDWKLERPPDVIIVGAPKCGTTSLHRYLDHHKDVHGTTKKEHHYYSEAVDDIYHDGLEPIWRNIPSSIRAKKLLARKKAFQAEVDEAPEGTIVLESTPDYLQNPETPMRIYEQNPDTKIIIMVRDFAERMRSHFKMHRRAGSEQRTFEEFQREGIPYWERGLPYGNRYLVYGEYGTQIERYLKVFDRRNVLVENVDNLKKDKRVVMRRVALFLGIDPDGFEKDDDKHYNTSWLPVPDKWLPGAKEALRNYYEEESQKMEEMGIASPGVKE